MSFRVVVLSASATNLVPAVGSILACEARLDPSYVIVVDDGARVAAEAHLPAVTWIAGERPFVFARNANLGIRAAGVDDVILMNDDARLLTPGGFTHLSEQVRARPSVGICSAGVRGVVGNPRQLAARTPGFRVEPRGLAFVCVYMPRGVLDQVGPLDERFTGYGFEDNDYCERVRAAGLQLGVWDGCVVDHSGERPSSFRTRPDLMLLFERNRRLYREKWGRDA